MKKNAKLTEITGETVKGWYEWLTEQQCGCCSVAFETDDYDNYCVCMGWHDCGRDEGWKVAWKIGRQSVRNCMQTDLDVDFEMPYDEETGYVDDTETVFESKPRTAREWNAVAASMRKEARRVWSEWKRFDPEEDED